MSSIFGICNITRRQAAEPILKRMQDVLAHWEPDDRAIWTNGQTGLGHLLLRNTPESERESQPWHYQGLTITADARLYNRADIYPLLGLGTTAEQALPDCNLILLLYLKYKAGCVKYLVGDFAFAIWDEGAQQLFCARDQIGVKPFFYYNNDGFLAFASAKKGILCLPEIDKKINKEYFYNQALGPRVQAANATFYQHIMRLAPAHTLVYRPDSNSMLLERYWTLDTETEIKYARPEEYYEGLLHHFEQAVKSRLHTGYPIGAEMSGGIDSSSVTGVAINMLRTQGRSLITFSNVEDVNDVTHTIPGGSELKYINEVVRFNDIKDAVYVAKDIWAQAIDAVEFSLFVNDGLEMQSLIWQLAIKKAAMERGVRTLLTGFGGDQMVTYRGQFYFLDYLDKGQYKKYLTAKSERYFNRLKPFCPP